METNETLKTALLHETEAAVATMIAHLHTLPEGDLHQLEQTVMSACLALGQRWMEEVLNHPCQANQAQARRAGECGHQQRLVGSRPRQLLTLMGKVTLRRPYYQCMLPADTEESAACSHGQAPFDALWGLGAGRSSPGVQKLVSYLGASMTLEEAAAAFQAMLPVPMSARQALTLLQPVGETLRQQEEEQQARLFAAAATKHTVAQSQQRDQQAVIRRLYIELDGVLARLRRDSVLMEAQEQQRAGDVYREIKVGAVFPAVRGRTRSELSVGTFVDQAGPIQYVARRTTAATFGRYLYALAQRCGLEHAQEVVVLGDGAVWIWHLVAEHFPQAVQIVDLWHAREHVWKVARAVFGSGTAESASWAEQGCRLLEEGHIEDLVAEMAGLPAIPPEPGTSRSVRDIEMQYFIANAARMRYPAFRTLGMQIGSGIAEAACKTVVSTRAKRSGMRWTPGGLDAVLALRTAVLNQTYESFWQQQPRLIA